ncbi:hypothetical protein [Nonomuraea sp. NPDC005650]|uniref:hypothetical protein n=1 Tax=Nonomuraea sp. NPDC005650 TaxID=3157045 RepID=UPI0033BED4A8
MADKRPTNELIQDAVLMFMAIMARTNAPSLVIPCPIVGDTEDLVVPPRSNAADEVVRAYADHAPAWIGAPVSRAIIAIDELSYVTVSRAESAKGTPMRQACRQEIRRLLGVLRQITDDLAEATRIN